MYTALMPDLQFTSGEATHTGCVRSQNEDRVLRHEHLGLFLLADGMGGLDAGDIASDLAVRTIARRFSEGMELGAAVYAADAAIDAATVDDMATTVVALALADDGFELAWVGDSRAYRLRDAMERLTTDHSYVQELLDRGVIDPAQARHHPQRNILTRALGKLQVQGHRVDTISGPVRSGDTFLLCSDGLTDMLGETEISDIVTSARDPHSACDSLVDAALRAGGHDNVSVLIVQVGKDRG